MKHISLLLVVYSLFSITKLVAQDEEFGLASYYSDDFQGRNTAYGDTYDKNEMTCAHKRYPYGTRLRVTRLDNNQSVVVKVIDKGPFIKGRVVDLSRRAAEQLGIIEMRSVTVKVEKVTKIAPIVEAPPKLNEAVDASRTDIEKPSVANQVQTATPVVTPREVVTAREIPEPVVEEKIEKSAPIAVRTEKEEEPKTTRIEVKKSSSRSQLVGDNFTPYGLYKIVLEKPEQNGFGVQVASLSNFDNVLKKVANLQAKWFDNILISMEAGTEGNNQYKVILGPFATQKEAQHYQASMKSRYSIDGFVINLAGLKY